MKRAKVSDSMGARLLKSDRQNQFMVTEEGELLVRGRNLMGELGIGGHESKKEWSSVEGLDDKEVINLWSFDGITYVCTTDGDLYASGYNHMGQLGVGDRQTRYSFTPVVGLEGSHVIHVIRDQFFMWDTQFILTQDGKIYRKLLDDLTYQHVVEIEAKVIWIKSCFGSVFACTESGRLWACGRNLAGCLGLGDKEDRQEFVHVQGIPPMHCVDQLVLAYNNSVSVYALTRDGFLFTWGQNYYGQLGHGHRNTQITPKEVTSTQKCDYKSVILGEYEICAHRTSVVKGLFKSIKVFESNVYAISLEGDLFVCGLNNKGLLGLGHKQLRMSFEKVEGINGAVRDVVFGEHYVGVMTEQYDTYRCDGVSRRFTQLPNLLASGARFGFGVQVTEEASQSGSQLDI